MRSVSRRFLFVLVSVLMRSIAGQAQTPALIPSTWLRCIQVIGGESDSLDIHLVKWLEEDNPSELAVLFEERASLSRRNFLYSPSRRVYLFNLPVDFDFSSSRCFTFRYRDSSGQIVERTIDGSQDQVCDPRANVLNGEEITGEPDLSGSLAVAQRVLSAEIVAILREADARVAVLAGAAREDSRTFMDLREWRRETRGERREITQRVCRRVDLAFNILRRVQVLLQPCGPLNDAAIAASFHRLERRVEEFIRIHFELLSRRRLQCPRMRAVFHRLRHSRAQ